ncbi:transporter substrate-binding domain-containing protein [Pseudomonas fluorescens]|uniref:L-cystine-binding protein FliY n=1 Tax=Pseudomonas fluorescens TaxID=294 RepID=A0A5E7BKX2_PSEFL|nr:transporter substrate-binding domain-containing protein [Pseudomonas fluorescens]VVN90167.1 L-cystine-binding protein FliY [Pseudomonas fluorescens]
MKVQQKLGITLALAATMIAAQPAIADKLDDVISSGELKCGVMLDYPPNGFRDAANNPAGYDVEYCHDLAKALGVKPMIVETSSPQRIPALLSSQVDISIASATITLERAKTVAFTSPYSSYSFVVVARKDSSIKTFEDLKGKRVAGVRGAAEDALFQNVFNKWNVPEGKYLTVSNDSDRNLALAQGKVDAFIVNVQAAVELEKLPQFAAFHTCCDAPFPKDTVGMMVTRENTDFLRFTNLFLRQQQVTGRYAELYKKWYQADAPVLDRL